MCILRRTCADVTFLFLSEVYDLFQLLYRCRFPDFLKAWWRSLLFCFLFSVLHPPARSLRAWSRRIPLACCLLALLMLTYLYFILLFPPFFDFDLDIVCFHPVFFLCFLCCLLGFGFCCDSFSIRYICILIRTYADLTVLFLSEVYDLFQLLCVRIIFCFYICSPPEVIFR